MKSGRLNKRRPIKHSLEESSMSDEKVLTQPVGKNGALAFLHPEWRAEIREVDESIFISNDALFRMTRAELTELREKMQEMAPVIQHSNNAFAQMRFSTQSQTLATWQRWLDYPTHVSFDSTQGYQLLPKNDVPVTAYLLDQAYAHIVHPEPVKEPEVAPSIIRQPESVVASPLEMVSFSVVAEGSNPLEYTWLINGQIIPGEHAKKSSYSTVATEYNNNGVFTCLVTNKFGSATSVGASLWMIRSSI
jgi:hypothetical protein